MYIFVELWETDRRWCRNRTRIEVEAFLSPLMDPSAILAKWFIVLISRSSIIILAFTSLQESSSRSTSWHLSKHLYRQVHSTFPVSRFGLCFTDGSLCSFSIPAKQKLMRFVLSAPLYYNYCCAPLLCLLLTARIVLQPDSITAPKILSLAVLRAFTRSGRKNIISSINLIETAEDIIRYCAPVLLHARCMILTSWSLCLSFSLSLSFFVCLP